MSALYERLHDPVISGRRGITRTAHHTIKAQLETWYGGIRVELDRDGEYRVYVGAKLNPSNLIATGNVEEEA